MHDDDWIIPSGPFKGKKIEFASTTGIEMFFEIAEDFMQRILDFEPGITLLPMNRVFGTSQVETHRQ